MEQQLEYRVLAMDVLAVAVLNYRTEQDRKQNEVFDWAVYVGPVRGQNHDSEKHEVARSGQKQPRELAALLFPYPIHSYRD